MKNYENISINFFKNIFIQKTLNKRENGWISEFKFKKVLLMNVKRAFDWKLQIEIMELMFQAAIIRPKLQSVVIGRVMIVFSHTEANRLFIWASTASSWALFRRCILFANAHPIRNIRKTALSLVFVAIEQQILLICDQFEGCVDPGAQRIIWKFVSKQSYNKLTIQIFLLEHFQSKLRFNTTHNWFW